MANPYFLGCDLSVPTYTWSVGVNASYPVSNLKTYFIADRSRSNATTAGQYLTIDFGSAVACDSFIVYGSNFASVVADVGIYLQYNSNDDTNWADAVTVATLSAFSFTQIHTFNSVTKRYWRILFSSSAPLAAAPEIANIFLGTRTQFESTYEWDFSAANPDHVTAETVSLNGDIRMSQSYAGRRKWSLQFRLQSNTFLGSWNTFIGVVRGKLLPFYFVDVDSNVYYVHLDSDYVDVRRNRYNQNNLTIQLKSQTVS